VIRIIADDLEYNGRRFARLEPNIPAILDGAEEGMISRNEHIEALLAERDEFERQLCEMEERNEVLQSELEQLKKRKRK
jgi:hypothetical protein